MNEKRKPGRPKTFLKREKRVYLRMYEAEYIKFKEKANELGMSLSTFMMLAAREYLFKK